MIPGVTGIAAFAVVYLAWVFARIRSGRTAVARFVGSGQSLSSRFYDGGFEIRTDIYRVDIRFEEIQSIRCTADAVILFGGGLWIYPRELFPDWAIDRLLAVVPADGRSDGG